MPVREHLVAILRLPMLAAVMLGYGWLAFHAGKMVEGHEVAMLRGYVDSLLVTNGDGLCRRIPAHP
jgi:hypothetical protein